MHIINWTSGTVATGLNTSHINHDMMIIISNQRRFWNEAPPDHADFMIMIILNVARGPTLAKRTYEI